MNKSVMFKLDKERNFKYPFSSLKKLEELLGKPISTVDENMTFTEVQALIYCGLLWEDKKLTFEKTESILDNYFDEEDASFSEMMESAMTAVAKSLGKNQIPSK